MKKSEKPKEAPPAPTQKERALKAIERMPCFDKYWLERLKDAADEAKAASDGSLSIAAQAFIGEVIAVSTQWNELRHKNGLPAPWVAT